MTIKQLQKKVIEFRDARDWKQFHNPKDVAISLNLEASEVLELFQWLSKDEVEEFVSKHKDKLGDELVDVMFHVLTMAYDCEIDLADAFEKKMEKNNTKYPAEKVKGSHKKYTEYE